MKRYLTFKDEKSDKFWSVEVAGSDITVVFGKTGTPGVTNQKSFSSPEEALKEAEKLIREKIKKGYVESADETAGQFSEETFWGLIERAKTKSFDISERPDLLMEALEQRSEADILAYYRIFSQMMANAYRIEVWAAGYLINGGCSDDGFEYFRCWLIAHGKDTFYKTLENPDYLARVVKAEEMNDAELEDMLYVAVRAWEAKTGRDMEEFYKLVDESIGAYTPIENWWDFDDENEMKKHLPKLWAKFGAEN